MKNPARHIFFIICILLSAWCYSQDSTLTSPQLSSRYFDELSSKANRLNKKLDKESAKALRQWKKQEARIKRKLATTDSVKAAAIFENAQQQYLQLEQRLQTGSSGQYISSLDTMLTSLKFLDQNTALMHDAKDAQQKLTGALDKVKEMQNNFQKAEIIKKFLKERKLYLNQQLSQLDPRLGRQFSNNLKQLNKQVYYYSNQLSEYKALLKDRKKAERKALELLGKTKLFKDFMQRNSQLASLFRLPGNPDDPNDPAILANLSGLQTRAQVNNLIRQQLAGGGPAAQQQFRQNIQDAQSQLNQLKDKVIKMGGNSSDMEMPEGFKPNDQRTKGFLKRLELGTNVQTQRATNYFPVTSDIGLSVGYKLNDKSVIGIGASYKMGMGRGWKHVRVTNEGVGLRSFIDWKIKGSFWVSGGYEQNYKTAFSGFSQLRDKNAWQTSGLIGLSKVVSLKTKLFKKTKLQLLWDFLSYRQIPVTQPVLFRVCYALR